MSILDNHYEKLLDMPVDLLESSRKNAGPQVERFDDAIAAYRVFQNEDSPDVVDQYIGDVTFNVVRQRIRVKILDTLIESLGVSPRLREIDFQAIESMKITEAQPEIVAVNETISTILVRAAQTFLAQAGEELRGAIQKEAGGEEAEDHIAVYLAEKLNVLRS